MELMTFTNEQTMSSREIAEVTGKQHAHVLRDTRNLIEQGVDESNYGLGSYLDSYGKPRPEYTLNYKRIVL